MSIGDCGRPTLVMALKPSITSSTRSPMPASTDRAPPPHRHDSCHQVQRLYQQRLAAFVTRVLGSRHHFANHASQQHRSAPLHVDRVNYGHHRRVRRHILRMERETDCASAVVTISPAPAPVTSGKPCAPVGFISGNTRSPPAGVDLRDPCAWPSTTRSPPRAPGTPFPDASSTCRQWLVDGRVLAALRHTRGASGDHDDFFFVAGADGVNRDEVAGFVGAFWRDRLHDQQLLAFQAGIFPGGNHGAHHAGQYHDGSTSPPPRSAPCQWAEYLPDSDAAGESHAPRSAHPPCAPRLLRHP